METQFHYDLQQKQLNFRLRQKITTKGPGSGVELKGKGHFNTVTGKLSYVSTLRAGVTVGEDLKGAGSTPFRISGGVFVASPDVKMTPQPQLHAAAKKQISLFDGPRTVASLKAFTNLDPQSGTITARSAVVKFSHKWLGFTKKQDLKFAAGVDVDWPAGAKKPKPLPFATVRENNWALNYRRGRWFVTYDL